MVYRRRLCCFFGGVLAENLAEKNQKTHVFLEFLSVLWPANVFVGLKHC